MWLPRQRRETGTIPTPRPLTLRVFVASLILVSVFNPNHSSSFAISNASVTAAKQSPESAKTLIRHFHTGQTFTPHPSHLPALRDTVDTEKTRNRAIALAALIALGAAVSVLARSPGSIRLAP